MKNLLLVVIFFLLIKPVFALDVAESAAVLAYRTPDTLSDERVARLKAFLTSYGSPLVGEAKTFVREADEHNLDWKLVAAIAGVESTFGKQIPAGSFNAWGWGIPTGAQSGIGFENWQQGISTVSEGLAQNYFGRGAETIYDVGWIYAANGNSWGSHVLYFLNQIQEFSPTAPSELAVSI